ncbi:MAG: 3-isopropylmalate dehydratase large subunit, partial [Chloroflexota bacterium]|nr:3-isopropylmalate dehydratase large subunit [Chloroflexota bacterium]
MTLVEKILAAHTGRKKVTPGEFVNVAVDLVLANDITAPIAIKEFRSIGAGKVFNPQKVVMVPDHFVPNKDIASAEQAKLMREFAREQGVIYFEVGEMGIEHVLLPEQGLVLAGDVVIGADSHTCTYGALGAFATGMGSTDVAAAMATGDIWMKVPPTMKLVYHGVKGKWVGGKDLILSTIGDIGVDGALYSAMEFTGEAIDALSMDGRFTMANMAIEAGAKAGIFRVDDKTLAYMEPRARRPYTVYEPDGDAEYSRVIEYDVSSLEPQVALPHLPANTRPVSQVGDVVINQAVIGSCTNGRLEDLRLAAGILKGRKVRQGVRCIIIPGSQ